MKKVTCHLFHEPVEITKALIAVASHAQTTKDCDWPEYDLMVDAAERIRELEVLLSFFVQARKSNEYFDDNIWKFVDEWKESAHEDPDFKVTVLDAFWELL